MQEFLVSTGWLADHLTDPAIRIIDCRFAFDHDAREDYEAGHIPGALHLDWSKDLTDLDHEVDGMIAPPEKVEATMRRLGVSTDTRIIAYDHEGGHFASRLWLVLARYGRGEQVRILDGGWTAWEQEGRPTTTEVPTVPAGNFTVDLDAAHPELIADADDVSRASSSPDAVVLDVRRWTEFTGEEVRAARGGRVPGAVYSFWEENLNWNQDRRFRPVEDLQVRAKDAGIDANTEVITYCQGGVRAAHAAVALMLAGHTNVKVYDGSWAEWGNRDDLPIETGEPE